MQYSSICLPRMFYAFMPQLNPESLCPLLMLSVLYENKLIRWKHNIRMVTVPTYLLTILPDKSTNSMLKLKGCSWAFNLKMPLW